jgi:CobQ-like glutamine amidotransferase family enzyme
MSNDVCLGGVTIGWLYPSALSTYGDRGNVQALVQRARWRGFEARVERIEPLSPIPQTVDLFFIGGGQDSAQAEIASTLVKGHGSVLRDRLADGAALLAICGGYQLLCHEYVTLKGDRIPGVGIFDALTRASTARLVGNVLAASKWGEVVGFENHSGRTYLGAGAEAMGRVRLGQGNNGEDGTEGVISGRAIGSYLHGPLLPRNPAITDWLLSESLRRRDQTVALEELPDDREQATHVAFHRGNA